MKNYYKENLNSKDLELVYKIGKPRIQKYFKEEINFINQRLNGTEKILELGCGYGRIIKEIAPFASKIIGVDISPDSIEYGKTYLAEIPNYKLEVSDFYKWNTKEKFDVLLCLQNGISAMKGDVNTLIKKSIDLLNPGGTAYFSTYSPKFWDHRLEWFVDQSKHGLLGELDFEKSKDNKIQCKDGFMSISYSTDQLKNFGNSIGHSYEIHEVDNSSLFLIIHK